MSALKPGDRCFIIGVSPAEQDRWSIKNGATCVIEEVGAISPFIPRLAAVVNGPGCIVLMEDAVGGRAWVHPRHLVKMPPPPLAVRETEKPREVDHA